MAVTGRAGLGRGVRSAAAAPRMLGRGAALIMSMAFAAGALNFEVGLTKTKTFTFTSTSLRNPLNRREPIIEFLCYLGNYLGKRARFYYENFVFQRTVQPSGGDWWHIRHLALALVHVGTSWH